MVITCVHCGGKLTVTGDQLGSDVLCPHCRQVISLPAAGNAAGTLEEGEDSGGDWLTGWIPPLVSLVLHMLLLIILALVSWGTDTDLETGEEVMIGQLPVLELSSQDDESLETLAQEPVSEESTELTLDEPEVAPPTTAQGDGSSEELSVGLLAPSTGGDANAFDLGAVNLGGGGGGASGAGGWEGMLRRLRRNGLDIVLVFDSTSSMQGEIAQVKSQIYRIGTALHRLVPKTRISLCTYRDAGDAYLVKGTPLTDDLSRTGTFLAGIGAGGGGDTEEAVQAGLQWAVQNNDFRSGARKIILLFGDAPPHRQDLATCVRIAADFHDRQQGIVSTVTCRNGRSLPEFVEIAEAGGGEAFLTADERQIMTQLMVLVFGSRYRTKVVEALQLMRP